MRTVSGGENTVLSGAHYATHARVLVEDADGTYQDLTNQDSIDWVDSGHIAQTIDQIVATGSFRFWRSQEGGNSLAPLDEDSTLNRDAGASYAPLIDVGRGIRCEFATVAIGSSPAGGDWKRVYQGVIDDWSVENDFVNVFTRDALGAEIADSWVEVETTYGTGPGRAMEDVMQDILTAWTGLTLYTPASPSFLITTYTQKRTSVMSALQELAALTGWVVQPRWDNGTSAFRLTLFDPVRAPVSTDWTWAANRYEAVPNFKLSRLNIRNALSLWYTNTSGVRSQVTASDATSITNYDRQWMEIEEPADSPIDTETEAQDMLDNALLDLKDPIADQEIKTLCFWPIQLNDNYAFTANDVHYTANQEFGVTGFRHVFGGGHIDTFIQTRGKPAGFIQPWLRRVVVPSQALQPPPFSDLEFYAPLDEGSGLRLRDRSGHGRHATPASTSPAAITWVRGVAGMAIDFPGSGRGYVLLTDAQAGAIESLFYVSCWIKVDDTAGNAAARIITRDVSDYFAIEIEQDEAFPQDITFAYSDSQSVTLDDVIATAGVWYFILAQWDQTLNIVELWIGSEATGLLTRIFRSESLAAFATSTRPIVIGSNTEAAPNTSNPFDGSIDDVRVGAPVALLTHGEISSLFKLPGLGSEIVDFVPPKIQADFVRVSSTTAALDIVIEDPSGAVTAVNFNKREGSEAADAFSGWLSSWDRSTGTIGAAGTLTRGEDLLTEDGQESIIRYRITFTDEDGTSVTLAEAFSSTNVDEISTTVFYSHTDADDSVAATAQANKSSGYLYPGDTASRIFLLVAVLPEGVTITDYAGRMYRNDTGDKATITLRAVSNTGGLTMIGSLQTHATTGWATLADSGPNYTVSAAEQIQALITLQGVGGGSQARFSYLSITFTRHNYSEEL